MWVSIIWLTVSVLLFFGGTYATYRFGKDIADEDDGPIFLVAFAAILWPLIVAATVIIGPIIFLVHCVKELGKKHRK